MIVPFSAILRICYNRVVISTPSNMCGLKNKGRIHLPGIFIKNYVLDPKGSWQAADFLAWSNTSSAKISLRNLSALRRQVLVKCVLTLRVCKLSYNELGRGSCQDKIWFLQFARCHIRWKYATGMYWNRLNDFDHEFLLLYFNERSTLSICFSLEIDLDVMLL